MPSSRRRSRLPAATREQLVLEAGERPLAWATDREGRWYVGTDRALHLATDEGFRRLGWEQVERADWQQEDGRLAVVEVSSWGEPEPRTVIEVDDAGQLLELLRERVTKSVVATMYARVRGKAGLSVVGRRSPGRTGSDRLVLPALGGPGPRRPRGDRRRRADADRGATRAVRASNSSLTGCPPASTVGSEGSQPDPATWRRAVAAVIVERGRPARTGMRAGIEDVRRRSALIVATHDYQDPGLRQLRAPARDAEALAGVLGDPEIGAFDITTVINEPAHAITRSMERFFSERSVDDLLLVHYSGHGVKDESGDLYFAATDTELEYLAATAVPSEFVNRLMNRTRARRVVLLLDCCYAGAFERGLSSRGDSALQLEERLSGRGRAVITASTAMEYAFEGQDLTDSPEGAPSVFTSAVVEGLSSGDADQDQDGMISLDELYEYVYGAVRRVTPNQTPSKWSLGIQGELYLARRSRPITIPSDLPQDLLDAMESSFASVRSGAVRELDRLLRGRHAGLSLAARHGLEQLSGRRQPVRRRSGVRGVGDLFSTASSQPGRYSGRRRGGEGRSSAGGGPACSAREGPACSARERPACSARERPAGAAGGGPAGSAGGGPAAPPEEDLPTPSPWPRLPHSKGADRGRLGSRGRRHRGHRPRRSWTAGDGPRLRLPRAGAQLAGCRQSARRGDR